MINLEKPFPVVETSIGNRYYDLIVKQAIRRYFANCQPNKELYPKTLDVICKANTIQYSIIEEWRIENINPDIMLEHIYYNHKIEYCFNQESLIDFLKWLLVKYDSFSNGFNPEYASLLSDILSTIGVELI